MSKGVSLNVNASVEGRTLEQFAKVIQSRMKYMGETARDSIAACAIQALKSIRAVTKVAKLNPKVEVTPENNLYASCTHETARSSVCLRIVGSKQRYVPNGRIVIADRVPFSKQQVFKYIDSVSKREYMIVASSQQSARKKAQQMLANRIRQYRGLAKRAVGVLMMKTSTQQAVNDSVSQKVQSMARFATTQREVIAEAQDGSGGKYALILEDGLKYATDAINGGKASVDMAMRKAANKVMSIVKRKVDKSGLFHFGTLSTPFPEVQKKR